MRIDISELVDDVEKAFQDINFKKIGKTYIFPVAEELKIYEVPKDIRDYIEKIYPNLRFFCKCRSLSKSDSDTVINNFVVYILSKNSKDIERYKTYDVTRGIPYHKWFLTGLSYFWKNFKSGVFKDNFMFYLSNDFDICVDKENKVIFLDLIFNSLGDTIFSILKNQLEGTLQDYSFQNKNYFCFEKYAYDFYKHKLSGRSNREFAEKLRVSDSIISQWSNRLRDRVVDFLDGGQKFCDDLT